MAEFTKIALKGGAYTARSIIADAQRCVNLFPESNPEGAASDFTYYPTPGLVLRTVLPDGGPVRGIYVASNGQLFASGGPHLYYIDTDLVAHQIGLFNLNTQQPVRMQDNSTTLFVVDGSDRGYQVNLATHAFSQIPQANFFGSRMTVYLDSFTVFHRPGTKIIYSTESSTNVFNPLFFAQKNGAPDMVEGISIKKKELWVIGQKTTEVWYPAGGPAFPFAPQPGVLINHGTCAPYSIARDGAAVYWLSLNALGQAVALCATDYEPQKISTYALENEWSEYPDVSDAISFTYQVAGHVFWVLNFPSADKTWVFDANENLWHQRAWMDQNGVLHRHRANCHAFAYGMHLVGDHATGAIYSFENNVYTDNGDAISRIRSFPHLGETSHRVIYNMFTADMEVGRTTDPGGAPTMVDLRWSDDRGATWGNRVPQSIGGIGEFLTAPQWRRLGMARDRVFELSWAADVRTALNGAFIEHKVCAT